jgi:hypothetical protein
MRSQRYFQSKRGNLGEVAEASSIINKIGGKHVEIPSEVMAKPLVLVVEEVETQLVEKEGMLTHPQTPLWTQL